MAVRSWDELRLLRLARRVFTVVKNSAAVWSMPHCRVLWFFSLNRLLLTLLPLPLCGACPIVGYCGFSLNKLLTQKKQKKQKMCEKNHRQYPTKGHAPHSFFGESGLLENDFFVRCVCLCDVCIARARSFEHVLRVLIRHKQKHTHARIHSCKKALLVCCSFVCAPTLYFLRFTPRPAPQRIRAR